MGPVSKAIAGFIASAGAVIAETFLDDKHGELPTQGEWFYALIIGLIAFAGVYIAPRNKPRA